MLKSLVRILKAGTATQKEIFPNLSPESRGLPAINKEAWESRNKANGVEWTKCSVPQSDIRQTIRSDGRAQSGSGSLYSLRTCPDIPDGIIEKIFLQSQL
ncbi:MAG: hypothetical protein R3C24_19225 [Cyanobacteriota/Melainabacteria group bacterium]